MYISNIHVIVIHQDMIIIHEMITIFVWEENVLMGTPLWSSRLCMMPTCTKKIDWEINIQNT